MIAIILAWMKANRLATALGAVAAVFVLGWLVWVLAVGMGGGRERERAKGRVTESVITDSAVKEIAAEERLKDARRVAGLEEELRKADDQEDDIRPSDARRARLCGVWKQQSGGTSKLPAACRPGG